MSHFHSPGFNLQDMQALSPAAFRVIPISPNPQSALGMFGLHMDWFRPAQAIGYADYFRMRNGPGSYIPKVSGLDGVLATFPLDPLDGWKRLIKLMPTTKDLAKHRLVPSLLKSMLDNYNLGEKKAARGKILRSVAESLSMEYMALLKRIGEEAVLSQLSEFSPKLSCRLDALDESDDPLISSSDSAISH